MDLHAQEPLCRRESIDYWDREYGQRGRDLDLCEDPLLAIAYAISEWAITFVGPIFWMCLAYLFLVVELGH